jgi:hypothetical protein
VLAFSIALGASSSAWAQMQLTSSTAPALETMSVGAGRNLTNKGLASGLKLGEGAILHAAIFADIGYDSNVFFATPPTTTAADGSVTSASVKDAPVLHITPRLEITNAERDGSIPGGTYYDLAASLDFRKYLSSESTVTEQDAVNPTVGGSVEFSSGQALSFGLTEAFSRYQMPPYSAGPPITRDDNMAAATLRFAPGGGRLKVMLRYTNIIDKYEGSFDSGSNVGNEGVLDIGWRWLPKTSLYAQVAQGAITYFNTRTIGRSSYPLRTLLGIRGLLTAKLGVNIAAGYSNAFYSSIDSPSGINGNLGVITELNYQMSLLSRAGIGYHHDFMNSPFTGGYYNMDAVYGTYQQMVASRLVTYLYGRFENRRYVGVLAGAEAKRTDNYVVGGVAVDYMIGNFLMLGASYSLALNRTLQGATDNLGYLNYTKHVLLFRVGAVY